VNTFGNTIKRVIQFDIFKKITLNNIRHSYITWGVPIEKYSINYLSNLAMMMGHTMFVQQSYRI